MYLLSFILYDCLFPCMRDFHEWEFPVLQECTIALPEEFYFPCFSVVNRSGIRNGISAEKSHSLSSIGMYSLCSSTFL